MTAKDFLRALTPPGVWRAAHRVKVALGLSPIPVSANAEIEASQPLFDGSHSRTWWQTRDEGGQSSAQPYWEQRTHPGRARIAKAVAGLPGTSLLEVGCHAGPTLWAIAQQKNFDRLAGIELSPTILDFTKATLPAALGRDVELFEASAAVLPFADKSFDIVVTCMVLSCIGPEEIEQSLGEMLRVCRGYLVLGETFTDEERYGNAAGKVDAYPNSTYWLRNYAKMLEKKTRMISWDRLSNDEKAGGHLDSILVLKLLPD